MSDLAFGLQTLCRGPMSFSHSLKKAMDAEDEKDLINSLPTNVTHKILEKLPLFTAAQTSVLSKTWKDNWLSLINLVFDVNFWEQQKQNGSLDAEKYCSIVSNILFFHNGPVHKFHLHIPRNMNFKNGCLNLSAWLSFLSKNGIKEMELHNQFFSESPSIPSHIYHCTDLVILILEFVTLNHPPTDFKGFANLQRLDLRYISFKCDSLQSLISKCPRLMVLIIWDCTGVNHIVIDAPSLAMLGIMGVFESLSFKNIPKVAGVSLSLKETKKDSLKAKLVDAMVMLASSCQLQILRLIGDMCKLLAAGGIMRSFPSEFTRLNKLMLDKLDLDDFDVFCCTCFLISSCPNIEDIIISITSSQNVVQHKYEYDDKKKLSHLRTVKIFGIRGTMAELKLIEHLLAISDVLQNLFYKYGKLVDAYSELKMSRELMKLPRASTKARLVYLEH